MGESISVPLGLRTHERSQLDTFVDEIIATLRDLGLDDEADDIDDVTLTIEDGHEERGLTYTATTTADEWRTLVAGLSNVEGLKADWLRRKLAKRLAQKVDELREAIDDASESA